MKGERAWWVAGLLAGLIIGLSLSLIYTWVLEPPPLTLTTPAALNQHDKEVYIVLVAAAYVADDDLDRARTRLAKLEDVDVENTIIALAERYVSQGQDVRDVRALARLADSLGKTSAAVRPFIATPTPTMTSTPTSTSLPPTATPTRPTSTPTRTLTVTRKPTPTASVTSVSPTLTATRIVPKTPTPESDRYRVVQSVALCDRNADGLLRVYVRDAAGESVPGVHISVNWPGGSDDFYTGFKPEIDAGYADFRMQPQDVYRVELVDVKSEAAENVGGDAGDICPELPENVHPSWQIVFQLPEK